ncbi:MAG: nucleotidyltransferase domain-containing protein [Candidatus Margulisbacteria bacterium]|nr:nucleotidyltransferase domain-containing protein [Candidatus Margulisiibacteriota bacterium]
MIQEAIINNAVEYIKEKVAPEKIYLFGSYAKGTAGPDSDLDFLIIKKTDIPQNQRVQPLYSLDKTKKVGAVIGMDFIVYTPNEFEDKINERNSIAAEVLKTGKLLYDRQTNP